ncbi:ABC transporter substrate-binding protein [Paenibacillus glycinis]|uniref:Extracellular solute-binding protein n=1 Tax=Paenibacillus glycinis TaxID=2697035 RepID=A0ABW9XZ26_9BACL|nr:extracellular solute-binding protein [Paenibacillus glycinis]NBD27865.1 extracellular solute-binding protein [Paenibacillus glycinis]
MNNKAKFSTILLLTAAMALTACGSNSGGANSDSSANSAGSVRGSGDFAGSENGEDAPSPSSTTASSGDGRTVVTVAVPTNNRLMQQAEQAFEQSHPDIDIRIDAISTETVDKQNVMNVVKQPGQVNPDVEKYRTTVNTAIMSGKADDLFTVQDLNYGAYADKGLLADLGPYIDGDGEIGKGDVSKPVLDAMKRDGHTYTLPINFELNLLLGNREAIEASGVKIDDAGWTWDQFFDSSKQIIDAGGGPQAILTVGSELELFSSILRSSYGSYVDAAARKASFDSPEFSAMLGSIKEMVDQGLIHTGMDKAANDLFKRLNVSSPMTLMLFPQMYYSGKSQVYSTPGEGSGGSLTFMPDLMFAMNGKSEVKDAAWQFLQFLLSDEVQSNPGMTGIPVRQSSLRNMLDTFASKLGGGSVQIRTKDGESSSSQAPTITDEDKKLVEETVARVGTYVYEDAQVMTIVEDEADAFFKGEKSAEDAAKSIQNRVSTYLNE